MDKLKNITIDGNTEGITRFTATDRDDRTAPDAVFACSIKNARSARSDAVSIAEERYDTYFSFLDVITSPPFS